MIGDRVYLDWNATAPLRPEAREAMIAAMDVPGNPSSVHTEGRAAVALKERARAQIAAAFGAQNADIVFTSGATEAAALALRGRSLSGAAIEHDAVRAWICEDLAVGADGEVEVTTPERSTLQAANSETGILQRLPRGLALADCTQAFGKIPFAFDASGVDMALISAHKIGGPAGIGALVLRRGLDLDVQIRGGGQEMGRRSGTENLIGIAGFGAAAGAAARDLADGVWERVSEIRKILERELADSGGGTIFVGKPTERLPNTTCLIAPGWRGETQVIAMDLAGFAVSAGSACASGKVRESAVLRAMGYDAAEAGSALRVSIGPDTTEEDVRRFAGIWRKGYRRAVARAA